MAELADAAILEFHLLPRRLKFTPPAGSQADPDQRALTDADLEQAKAEGERRTSA